MADYANVNSIEALKQFRISLIQFAHTVNKALDGAQAEIQWTHTWLSHDRYAFWKNRVYVYSDKYKEAKLALNRKKIFDRALQGTPSSCVDERKALRIAEQRLKEAEKKFARVRFWISELDKEESNYKGLIQKLRDAVHVEIPNARANLDRMIGSLDAYVTLAPPETVMEADSLDESLHIPADVSDSTVRSVSDDTEDMPEIKKAKDRDKDPKKQKGKIQE